MFALQRPEPIEPMPSVTTTAETWRQKLTRRLELWLIETSHHKVIDGLWVGALNDPKLLPPIESALHLIKTCDPLRYARVSRDLDRIIVRVLPGEFAHFDPRLGVCCIDPRFVLAEMSSPEKIAATIVHEATHARLWRRGIRYEQEVRHRVEAVCYRRELAFSAKLPNGDGIREETLRSLSAYAKPESWSDDAVESRTVEGAAEALFHLGSPPWLTKVLLWIHRVVQGSRRFARDRKRLSDRA